MKCAIYTRKSSEEGLEQDFNSLAAQRESCEAYIKSQGWQALKAHYDDGGFSGGSLVRPALTQLLEHVAMGRIQVVVLYKIDRLTRALTDFAKLIEQFDAHNVSLVAVTQPFNTTTSMGRLTLNVLLSFAQFEREITGERIRDKIKASKQKGMWMGGIVPLGYDAIERQLIVNPAEAETVRHIFERYQQLQSVRLLKAELDHTGYVSKRRTNRKGPATSGRSFSRGSLYTLLRNPLYIGKIREGQQLYDGQHEASVDATLFASVQQILDTNHVAHKTRGRSNSLLAGILYDGDGQRMTPSHTKRHQQRYRYYVSQRVLYGGASTTAARIPAHEVEHAVIAGLIDLCNAPDVLIHHLTDRSHKHVTQLTDRLQRQAKQLQMKNADREVVRALLQRVTLTEDSLRMEIDLTSLMPPGSVPTTVAHVQEIPVRVAQCQHGKKLVIQGQATHEPDTKLIDALTRAHAWDHALRKVDSYQTLASEAKANVRVLSRTHQLVYLAPDIQLAILEGRQPPRLTLEQLTKRSPIPLAFAEQRAQYGFPRGDTL